MKSLRELFGSLDPASDAGRFSAVPVPAYESHRLARDESGFPFLLLTTGDDESEPAPPTVELENLRVRYDVPCQITRPNGETEEGRFSIVGCVNSDPALQDHFLRVMEGLLPAIGDLPSRERLSQTLDRAVELFRMMGRPAQMSVRGLWGELFLAARSSDPAQLVRSWHQEPSDVYDFNDGGQRVEVKTATGEPRRHHFSLEQLSPPEESEVIVASIYVQRAGAGASIFDIVDEVREALGAEHELVSRVDEAVAEALGRDWRDAQNDRFDTERAEASLEFYRASEIPQLERPLPEGVTAVRFMADLTQVEPRHPGDLGGTLFGAL